MADPISLAVGGAILAFVNSIGPRLIQRLIPVQFEEAQIRSVELQRERLADEQRRFAVQLDEGRRRLLIEHKQRMELAEWQQQLLKWPMEFMPSDFVRRSADCGGQALNIIIRQTDHRDASSNPSQADVEQLALKASLLDAEHYMLAWYTPQEQRFSSTTHYNGVLFYPDYRMHRLRSVQGMVAVLSNMLSTEPTVLLDIAIIKEGIFRLTISHWGEVFDSTARAVTLPPVRLDLSDTLAQPQKLAIALSLTISSVLAGMADTFQLLRTPHALPVPALPKLMGLSVKRRVAPGYWGPVTQAYLRGLAQIADRSPLLSSEMAARAALTSHAADQADYAQALLAMAVDGYRAAIRSKEDDEGLARRLSKVRAIDAGRPALLEALLTIRGIKIDPTGQRDQSPIDSIDDVYRHLGPSPKSPAS